MEVVDLDFPDFLAELRADYEDAPPYSRLYTLVINGMVPARRCRNRWRLPLESKATVAELLGLTRRAKPHDATA